MIIDYIIMYNIELIRQYDIIHNFFARHLIVLSNRFIEVRKKQVYSELLDIRLDK